MTHNLQKYYVRAKRLRLSNEDHPSTTSYEESLPVYQHSDFEYSVPRSSPENTPIINVQSNTTLIHQGEELSLQHNAALSDKLLFENNCKSELINVQKSRPDIYSFLKNWALNHNITHVALNDLLKYFINDYPQLPSDARTLLDTCRNVTTQIVHPGKYYHFGIKTCIENLLHNIDTRVLLNPIELDINVDGLPLAKSSNSQVYPILGKISGTNNVDMIGIYHGYEKPRSANEFLFEFVKELTETLNNGIVVNGSKISVKIRSFICDAPAKSFVTYTKGHSGYASCSKCHIEGDYLNNRICFPQINNLQLRTDYDFRMKIQESHHSGTSILENLPNFDMVNNFPLDYMHLVCLGVVKKMLLVLWCSGKPSTKLSFQKTSEISGALVNISEDMPIEFNRKPRSLNEVKRWKATEFRQFLFYTGPVVLKDKISTDRYINFLSLHVACSILSNSKHFHLLDYASELLKYFVQTFKILYGAEHISHNVHNLLHITHDVKNFGPLQDFSAFPYENYLQTILKSLRKSDKPLSQIIKRHSEKCMANNLLPIKQYPIYCKEHNNGPTLNKTDVKQYAKIVFKEFSLQIQEPDNCFSLLNSSIILLKNILVSNDSTLLLGNSILHCEDFYTNPCPSSNLGIYCTNNNIGPLEIFTMEDISHKCLKLKYGNKYIIMPLLHTK